MPRLLAITTSALLLATAAGPTSPAEARKAPGKAQSAKKKVKSPGADWDLDGLNNRNEKLARTKPRKADSDRDGTVDGREDADRDGVANGTEQLAKTNLRKRDSNGNGTADGAEDPDKDGLNNGGESLFNWHPRKPDTDNDGRLDGAENAGVVSDASGRYVTIALAVGGNLTAMVGEQTQMACRQETTPASSGGEDSDAFLNEPNAPSDEEPTSIEEDDDDPFGDEEFSDDPKPIQRSTRQASSSGACGVDVGDLVTQADVADSQFVVLDLLKR